jgi:hypothetical protein
MASTSRSWRSGIDGATLVLVQQRSICSGIAAHFLGERECRRKPSGEIGRDARPGDVGNSSDSGMTTRPSLGRSRGSG